MTLTAASDRAAVAQAVRAADWNFSDADTSYLSHNIHRYSGKFIPQIARQAIELLSAEGHVVLDPFCGSGTVLLEAALTRRRAVGIDLNPLATLISRVKVRRVEGALLRNAQDRLRTRLETALGSQVLLWSQGTDVPVPESDPRWHDPWYRKWFQGPVLRELIAIHNAIRAEPSAEAREALLVGFSDVLRRASNANGSYPNVMFDRRKGEVRPITPVFLERTNRTFKAVEAAAVALDGKPPPEVRLGDACSTGLMNESIDAIVTHPPYIGSVPYAEYGLLSLVWLGHDPKELDRQLTGGRRQSRDVVERFSAAYARAFVEFFRVLKPGGYCSLLVGNPVVRGQIVDLVAMTEHLAADVGFQLVATADRSGSNRRANKMSPETIVVLGKPGG